MAAAVSLAAAHLVLVRRMNSNAKPKARGVAGVAFFCLCLMFLGPLHTINDLQDTWSGLKPSTLPVVRQFVIIDTIMTVVVMLYGLVIGFVVWKGSPNGRRLAQQYLVVRILFVLVIGAIPLQWAYREFGARAARGMSEKMAPGVILQIAVCLLWLAYFVYSRRVREAYSTQ